MSIPLSRASGRARTRPGPRWHGRGVRVTAGVTRAAAGAVLAAVLALAAGCAGQHAAAGGSVTSCAQFGAGAIRRHVTVTAVPAACRGLSQVEVNVAVGRALRAAAAGVHGKARQRRFIARDSQYLAGLVRAAPAASEPAPAGSEPAPAGSPSAVTASAAPGGTALRLAALVAWLVTVGLGASMMARWISRPGRPRGRRAAGLNYAHLGLAVTGLLAWTGYLVTGVTGLAWAACGLLLPVAGLGMALVFLGPARSAVAPPGTAPVTAGAAGRAIAGRSAAVVVSAHVTVASVTILLAVLAAIGSG